MQHIWIVDAFTSAPFRGNPAAVMIVDNFPNAMPQIAAEMNLSETTFIKKIDTNHYHIRWFSPTVEVALCGHATLSAAHILFQEKHIQGDKILFDSLSGPLEITKENDYLILNFPLQKVEHHLDSLPFEKAFDLQDEIVEVVKALDDIIVVVNTEDIVKNLKPDFVALSQIESRAVIVTAKSQEYDFVSRFFGPRIGINEDPVTGSAHCKLADYWAKRLGKTTLRAYQASQRGGFMEVSVVDNRVLLKGKALTLMQGKWLIPIS